jgi:hypothetical protein
MSEHENTAAPNRPVVELPEVEIAARVVFGVEIARDGEPPVLRTGVNGRRRVHNGPLQYRAAQLRELSFASRLARAP